MDNYNVNTNEQKPKPFGHFLARAYLGWPGTFIACWSIVVALLETLEICEIINLTGLTFGLSIASSSASLILFVWNVFYWSATRNTRSTATYARGKVGTKSPTTGQKRDRTIRAGGDQEVIIYTAIGNLFMLIFMIWFYYNHGFHTFQPLEFSPNGFEIRNWFLSKFFKIALLAISAIVIFSATSTNRDSIRRLTIGDPKASGGIVMKAKNSDLDVNALHAMNG